MLTQEEKDRIAARYNVKGSFPDAVTYCELGASAYDPTKPRSLRERMDGSVRNTARQKRVMKADGKAAGPKVINHPQAVREAKRLEQAERRVKAPAAPDAPDTPDAPAGRARRKAAARGQTPAQAAHTARIRSLAKKGLTVAEIATKLGRSRSSVGKQCRDHGIAVARAENPAWRTPGDAAKARAALQLKVAEREQLVGGLIRERLTIDVIQQRTGLSRGGVRKIAARLGLRIQPKPNSIGRAASVAAAAARRAELHASAEAMLSRGEPIAGVAHRLGVCENTIRRIAGELGLTIRQKVGRRGAHDDAVRRLHAEGLSLSEISRRTGLTMSGARKVIARLGRTRERIAELHREGLTVDQIAARSGLTSAPVHEIVFEMKRASR